MQTITSTAFLGLAFTGGASLVFASPNIIPPDPQITPAAVVQARNDIAPIINARTPADALYNECDSFYTLVDDSYPTAPSEVDTWYHTATEFNPPQPTMTARPDPSMLQSDRLPNSDDYSRLCSSSMKLFAYTPPVEIVTAYSSYKDAVSQWRSSSWSEVSSQATKCLEKYPKQAGGMLYYIATDVPSCLRAINLELGAAGRDESEQEFSIFPAASTTIPSNLAGPTTSTSIGGAAGPRETGYVATAALAVVGAVMGVIGGF